VVEPMKYRLWKYIQAPCHSF